MNREESIFSKFLKAHGLKLDKSRLAVFRAFQKARNHFSAEEILDAVRGSSVRVGIATVWRTLRLIQKAGLAEEHYFGKAGVRYEKKRAPESHGHIVCDDCGRTAEFDISKFLPLINDTMKSKGFSFDGYELSLFGSCRRCCRDESEKNKTK